MKVDEVDCGCCVNFWNCYGCRPECAKASWSSRHDVKRGLIKHVTSGMNSAGRCIQAQGNGFPVGMGGCDPFNPNQQFEIRDDGLIVNIGRGASHGWCLSSRTANSGNNIIELTSCDRASNPGLGLFMHWRYGSLTIYRDTSRPQYAALRRPVEERCIDVWEGNAGGIVHTWDCDYTNNNQLLQFIRQSFWQQLYGPAQASRGHCVDILSETECVRWARDRNLIFDDYKSSQAPKGCYQWHYPNENRNRVYYNANGYHACSDYRRCICKGAEGLSRRLETEPDVAFTDAMRSFAALV